MHKLKLNVDALQVESFQVIPPSSGPRGTVRGQGFEPLYPEVPSPSFDACAPGGGGGGGNIFTYTCIGPTYCCAPTWQPTCWKPTCSTCEHSCNGGSCVDTCYPCPP